MKTLGKIKRNWFETSKSDKIRIMSLILGIFGFGLSIFGFGMVFYQLRMSNYQLNLSNEQLKISNEQLKESNKANRFQMASELYTNEFTLDSDEMKDEESDLSTIWALVPKDVTSEQYGTTLLKLITDDQSAINSKNVVELYYNMWSSEVFSDKTRRDKTMGLRKLFLYTQNYFYHIHMASDYESLDILSEEEWLTWKGPIAEMHAHPVLLTVIWRGYENKYFSKKFATFLRSELCSESASSGVDPLEFKRQKEFTLSFYHQMCDENWLDILPNYEEGNESSAGQVPPASRS